MPPDEQLVAEGREFSLDDLSRYMQIEGIRGNRITGRIHEPVAENLAAIKRVFRDAGSIACFELTPEGHAITWGYAPPKRKRGLWVNLLLFALTIVTTLLVGSINNGGDPFRRPLDMLLLGWPFSLSIILVLGSHELAHYFTARRLGVAATPPYFLPVPHPMTGTMGAFIRIDSPVPTKSALVRVGVSGPLIGFLVALPVCFIGLMLSKPVDVIASKGIQLGSPLIFWAISELLHPNLGPGKDLMLHPAAFAGWLGLFVTAMNLLPIGQLDGGHVAYAVFGRRWRKLSWFVIAALVLMGFFWAGWPFWAVLAVMLGLRHPPPLDDITPLNRADWRLVAVAVIIIVLTLTPAPFGSVRF
ncbi:site-2 protease family protein [candidate division WOR-3 bacterium]|uniref:Site-2 protease family protein n=1 Tax=candidate division WOR-3 bacterium TaxID=2052148 RepID=A0A938BSS3_UNCW3|nr:site-2 protease family protein [candidate division WOR-3 bacterium]